MQSWLGTIAGSRLPNFPTIWGITVGVVHQYCNVDHILASQKPRILSLDSYVPVAVFVPIRLHTIAVESRRIPKAVHKTHCLPISSSPNLALSKYARSGDHCVNSSDIWFQSRRCKYPCAISLSTSPCRTKNWLFFVRLIELQHQLALMTISTQFTRLTRIPSVPLQHP